MSDLLETTMRLLADTSLPRRQIAMESGVGYEWLAKFARGCIPDPGVSRVQKLHDYLAQQQNSAA